MNVCIILIFYVCMQKILLCIHLLVLSHVHFQPVRLFHCILYLFIKTNNFDYNQDIIFSSNHFLYPINNFYMSDVVSKNSKIMAKCAQEILDQKLDKAVNQ